MSRRTAVRPAAHGLSATSPARYAAPPVQDLGFVLIHGGGASGAFWDRLVPRLTRPALAVDLPGRGGKPTDPMTFTVDEGVRSVLADVDARGTSTA